MTTRILIDNSLQGGAPSYLFTSPRGEVRADRPEQVEDALAALSDALGNGAWAAGFCAYELGYVLEPRLRPLLPGGRAVPLLRFALFDAPEVLEGAAVESALDSWSRGPHAVTAPEVTIDRGAYGRAFAQVKDFIAAGDIYQLNLTFKGAFRLQGCPVAFYRDLRRRQPVAHGALLAFDDLTVLSLSPELFLEIRERRARTRPMKGTAARGLTPDADERQARRLAQDEKSRAENLMIVDLMRNDLGRVAETASVAVSDLFSVETLRTLHQMTSGVEARLRDGTGVAEILHALFPPGSVTGAPKLRAMEIIHTLESAPRGVYTGAIGWLGPDGAAAFNVAIRTITLQADGRGEIGIGSGVVQDSQADAEYEECLLKMRFLTDPVRDFDLIETLRLDADGRYFLLERHLDRLERSARYFGYPMRREAVRRALEAEAGTLPAGTHRVRLLLSRDGALSLASAPFAASPSDQVMRYAFSPHTVDSRDVLLYHKTTLRDLYDGEHARLSEALGADEVLFVNERGELTEGSRTNIFLEFAGRLATPPVTSGLLAGTLRADLLARGEAYETQLTPVDLRRADAVYLGNSVRGLVRAESLDAPARQARGA